MMAGVKEINGQNERNKIIKKRERKSEKTWKGDKGNTERRQTKDETREGKE